MKEDIARSGLQKLLSGRTFIGEEVMTHKSNLDLVVDIDLTKAWDLAEMVSGHLRTLRNKFDLSRFEYTRQVRIAPGEIPHSHPVLTLGTWSKDEEALLCSYLHEQMHWYLWRLGSPDFDPLAGINDELQQKYPAAPTKPPEGARDSPSTYLHLIINWLEIDTVASFIGRPRAGELALSQPFYKWIYRTVLADWNWLEELYRRHNVLPMRPASAFADEIATELTATPPTT